MRSEWAKSHARAQRWSEEAILLVEEMRRVIEFLDRKAQWWQSQRQRRPDARTDVIIGLDAYAERQACIREDLAKSFASRWHGLLVTNRISISWPEKYIRHAIAHPAVIRAPRRRKYTKSTIPTHEEPDDEDQDDGEDEAEDGVEGLSEGEDDLDVSPYRT